MINILQMYGTNGGQLINELNMRHYVSFQRSIDAEKIHLIHSQRRVCPCWESLVRDGAGGSGDPGAAPMACSPARSENIRSLKVWISLRMRSTKSKNLKPLYTKKNINYQLGIFIRSWFKLFCYVSGMYIYQRAEFPKMKKNGLKKKWKL